MTMAVAETLGVDIDTANHLRRKYWKRYGATMIGWCAIMAWTRTSSCTAAMTST